MGKEWLQGSGNSVPVRGEHPEITAFLPEGKNNPFSPSHRCSSDYFCTPVFFLVRFFPCLLAKHELGKQCHTKIDVFKLGCGSFELLNGSGLQSVHPPWVISG